MTEEERRENAERTEDIISAYREKVRLANKMLNDRVLRRDYAGEKALGDVMDAMDVLTVALDNLDKVLLE